MDSTRTWAELSEKLDFFLRKTLTPARYIHSLAVAGLCRELCGRFGFDSGIGCFTGLGHDAARELPEKQLLAEAPKDGRPLEAYEKKSPLLLHGRVSALILEREFGVRNEEILEAVRCHTLGRPGLSLLGKILFVADYCEPNRTYIDAKFRELCLVLPLDGMVIYILDNERIRGYAFAPPTQLMYDNLILRKTRGKAGEKE
jgi:nicotinate-nucleotide adenylyltransferase